MARILVYPSFDSPKAVDGTCHQWRPWSDCAEAQADLSLHWSHKSYCKFCPALAHITCGKCSQTLNSINLISINKKKKNHNSFMEVTNFSQRKLPPSANSYFPFFSVVGEIINKRLFFFLFCFSFFVFFVVVPFVIFLFVWKLRSLSVSKHYWEKGKQCRP